MTALLYIGGIGRSGSTLLERLLAQDAGVCAVGELHSLWQRCLDGGALCGCGQRLDSCPLWRAVLARVDVRPDQVVEQQRRVDRTRFLPLLVAPWVWPPFARRLRSYATLLDQVYAELAAHSGSAVIVDSSKQPANAVLLRHVYGVDLRVVHLVRDSRGVAYSWTKRVDAEPRPDAGPMTRYAPARISLRWSMYNVLFAGLRLLGVPVLRLHYEDLVADPQRALARVAAFGRVPSAGAFLDASSAQLDRPGHTVAGNPVRFARGRVDLLPDDAWRTALPRHHRLTVSVLSWPMLVRYGYILGRRRPR
jgi:hypothetical protein